MGLVEQVAQADTVNMVNMVNQNTGLQLYHIMPRIQGHQQHWWQVEPWPLPPRYHGGAGGAGGGVECHQALRAAMHHHKLVCVQLQPCSPDASDASDAPDASDASLMSTLANLIASSVGTGEVFMGAFNPLESNSSSSVTLLYEEHLAARTAVDHVILVLPEASTLLQELERQPLAMNGPGAMWSAAHLQTWVNHCCTPKYNNLTLMMPLMPVMQPQVPQMPPNIRNIHSILDSYCSIGSITMAVNWRCTRVHLPPDHPNT